jgi:hypothetical protein
VYRVSDRDPQKWLVPTEPRPLQIHQHQRLARVARGHGNALLGPIEAVSTSKSLELSTSLNQLSG